MVGEERHSSLSLLPPSSVGDLSAVFRVNISYKPLCKSFIYSLSLRHFISFISASLLYHIMSNSQTTTSTIQSVHSDPRLDARPDFSLPAFEQQRSRLTGRGIPEDVAVEILEEHWDDEHAARVQAWDDTRAASSAPTNLNTLDGPTQDETHLPTLPETPEGPPENTHSGTQEEPSAFVAIIIDEDKPRPPDNLPPFANIVHYCMANRKYIELFYLTAEGRMAADREGLNGANFFDSEKRSMPRGLKTVTPDRDLSMAQIHEASMAHASLIHEYGWGVHAESMMFDLFYAIDSHPSRHNIGEDSIGPKSLALYLYRNRKRWHDNLALGKPVYSIAKIDEQDLAICVRDIQNDIFNSRMAVSFLPFFLIPSPSFPYTSISGV